MMGRKHLMLCCIAAFALIALVTAMVQGQTIWYVDDNAPNDPGPGDPSSSDPDEDGSAAHPFDAIQEGIDAAVNADEVVVLDGMYTGQGNRDLDYNGKAIIVRSEDGPEVTIIDCQDAGRGFYFHSGEGADSVVEGFTITNSYASSFNGGIYCYTSSPKIVNNTVMGNNGVGIGCYQSSPKIESNTVMGNNGGGIYCGHYSSPTIVNNTITANSADNGGGIECHSSSPTIANNTITGNNAIGDYADGGGICCDESSATIVNNTITGNSASIYGGGIDCDGSSSTIINNTITGNIAKYGGGIRCGQESSATVVNNTIIGNSARWGGGIYCYQSNPMITNNAIASNSTSLGGGIYCNNSNPMIRNNTITGNSATSGGGGGYCYRSSPTIANTIVAFNSSGIYKSGSSTPTLRYNCVYENTAYNYSGITDPTGTYGNISEDPKLASVEYGNVHIQPDSPCKDMGSNADAYGDLDIDGQPRIQPGGGTVDIGADESDGTVWPAGPYAIVRVSTGGDDANDGSSWALAKRTVQAGIDAASILGGEVWIQTGTYYERITLHPYAHVYGGFAGTETERNERDWTANATILDGQQGGSVVTVQAGHAVSTIDGFTITNGSTSYSGGGICCGNSSPTIANNMVTNNSASYDGGGMYCYSSNPTLINCMFTGNYADRWGGGMCGYPSSPTLANCTFVGNSATWSGGGMYYYGGSPMLTNCTLTGNSVGRDGGGIYGYECQVTVANCIFWGNDAANGPQINLDFYDNPCELTVSYSDIEGGQNGVYIKDGCTLNWGDGNIDANPGFALSEDYHLIPDSPCIDAGTNNPPVSLPSTDRDGNPRPLDGDGDSEPRTGQAETADMGAYEYNPEVPCIAVSPAVVEFFAPQGGVNPSDQVLSILNCGGQILNWQVTEACSWLNDPVATGGNNSGEVIDEIILSAEVTGLEHGDHLCELSVYDPQAVNDPRRVLVIFHVNTTLHVPSEYETIQEAIDAAVDGDVVLVADGTYTGPGNNKDLDFHGKAITVRSENGPKNTVIDHEDGGCGVYGTFYLHSGEGPNSVVDGLTITNVHTGGEGGGLSGGIACIGSSPTIANCIFLNNSSNYGGGMYCCYSSPTITNCTFIGDRAEFNGGGMFCENKSNPTVIGCTFSENQASDSGGGIYCDFSAPTITNNTITGNSAANDGGGISVYGSYSSPKIANTIIAFNSSGIYGDSYSNPVLSHNCVYGNTDYDYSGITDPTGTEGNISVDPLFMDKDGGDYRLASGSPCIDAGDNEVVPTDVTTDLAGNLRFVDDPDTPDCPYAPGTCGTPPIVDMGAYEYIPIIPGDYNRDGDVDGSDAVMFESCASGPLIPYVGDCATRDFDSDNDVDQEDFSFFQRCYSGPGNPANPHCAD